MVAAYDFDQITLDEIFRPPPAWMKDAACVEHADHADDWFPTREAGSTAMERAKWVCTSCLVRGECRRYAIEHDIREGVWGGLSPQERRLA